MSLTDHCIRVKRGGQDSFEFCDGDKKALSSLEFRSIITRETKFWKYACFKLKRKIKRNRHWIIEDATPRTSEMTGFVDIWQVIEGGGPKATWYTNYIQITTCKLLITTCNSIYFPTVMHLQTCRFLCKLYVLIRAKQDREKVNPIYVVRIRQRMLIVIYLSHARVRIICAFIRTNMILKHG